MTDLPGFRAVSERFFRQAITVALLSSVLGVSAIAQVSPPLPAYVPPPTTTPLAPLAGSTGPGAASPENMGEVRATSSTSANIAPGDTTSLIAPALPTPQTGSDTVRAYLYAAQRALQDQQTGTAQEALERAESRALDRSVAPAAAGVPAGDGLITAIQTARAALGSGRTDEAKAAIEKALGSS